MNPPGVSEAELQELKKQPGVVPRRIALAGWVESPRIQSVVVAVIVLNAIILGLETSAAAMASWGGLLVALDRLCLGIFIFELAMIPDVESEHEEVTAILGRIENDLRTLRRRVSDKPPSGPGES